MGPFRSAGLGPLASFFDSESPCLSSCVLVPWEILEKDNDLGCPFSSHGIVILLSILVT